MPIFYPSFSHVLYLVLNAVFSDFPSVSNTKIVYATIYNLLALLILLASVIYIYYLFKYFVFTCILFFIKVRENDLNGDGQKDSLRFEAHFYTDKPVKSLRLLLFFNFQLKVHLREYMPFVTLLPIFSIFYIL